jgi:molybdate transport system substrate-binding protein
MKSMLGIFLVFCLCLASSGQGACAGTGEMTVSAAMSLKNAFEEIGTVYARKNGGAKVVFNFGPSGGLVRQIESGAPVDVFASASPKEMDEIEKKGLTVPGSRFNFAANTLVLVVPRGVRKRAGSFPDLKKDAVRRIAAGDPKTVPAGRYAEEIFRYYGLSERIKDKLILAGNVRQVLDYIARGEVDAGVVYRSDVLSRPAEVEIVAEAPGTAHEPTLYPIAAVKGTRNEGEAKAFISLVVSAEGKKILEKYGFKAER